MKIGPRVCRFRWFVLAGWLTAGAALGVFGSGLDPAANEPDSFLPATSDHVRAVRALRECFPEASGLGEAVVVFERAGAALTKADLDAIESVAREIPRPRPPEAAAADLAGIRVRSPASFRLPLDLLELPANPLESPDHQAALIVVHVPANFVTIRSSRVVDHVREVVASARLPEGLAASVTGSSGFGHDYAEAGKRSHERIRYVTLAAVIVILLLVYRAPMAALVPLIAISAAAFVAVHVLAIAQHVGMHVGTGERIFCFVLIYGAGMDYSLLFISRCREFLDAGHPARQAVALGLGATFPAILASAGTDAVGLLMLCTADYGMFRTAGPAIAAALAVALLAAVTLVPALAALLGRTLFWPGRHMGHIGGGRLWPRVARWVTARPGLALVLTIALMAVPAVQALRLTWIYDALAEIPVRSPRGVGNAAAGIGAAKRHWPTGQIAPVTVLLRNDAPLSVAAWRAAARKLTADLSGVAGVSDVRSFSQPLGREAAERTGLEARAVQAALSASGQVRDEYLSADRSAMRLQAVLDKPALTLEAMDTVDRVRDAARAAGLTSTIHLAGATAEMIDIRKITSSDVRRIMLLVLGVIFLMVLALLREPILSAFMVAGTVLSYLATLGLSAWAFQLAGHAARWLAPVVDISGWAIPAAAGGGLDWKVEVFLFVVMVAVGVDYSIFLAARVSQEARGADVRTAVRRAVVHTGPVISSCGVIMAATLGSLMAGELKLFVQMGLALALGMLIDTFVVRPVLLPAFIALTGRTGTISKVLE